MIEIDLSPEKKGLDLSNIGGLDLTKINLKGLFIALLFMYVPDSFIRSYYQEQKDKINTVAVSLRKDLRKLSTRIKQLNNIEKQVDELNAQEKRLSARLGVVKQIISKRQNPINVLMYIAKNTPNKLWITSMDLIDKSLTIEGESQSYKDIGKFIDNLKSSIFFDRNISYEQNKTKVAQSRFDSFIIKAKIVRFE